MKSKTCISCGKELKKDKHGVYKCYWVMGMRVCNKCYRRGTKSTIGRGARPFYGFKVR